MGHVRHPARTFLREGAWSNEGSQLARALEDFGGSAPLTSSLAPGHAAQALAAPWGRVIVKADREFGPGVLRDLGLKGLLLRCPPASRGRVAVRLADQLLRRWRLRPRLKGLLLEKGARSGKPPAQEKHLALQAGLFLASSDTEREQSVRLGRAWITTPDGRKALVSPLDLDVSGLIRWYAQAAKRAAASVIQDEPWPRATGDALDRDRTDLSEGMRSDDAHWIVLDGIALEEDLSALHRLLAVAALTPSLQELLDLFLISGDWDEAGQALGLKPGARRARKHRLMQTLRAARSRL